MTILIIHWISTAVIIANNVLIISFWFGLWSDQYADNNLLTFDPKECGYPRWLLVVKDWMGENKLKLNLVWMEALLIGGQSVHWIGCPAYLGWDSTSHKPSSLYLRSAPWPDTIVRCKGSTSSMRWLFQLWLIYLPNKNLVTVIDV